MARRRKGRVIHGVILLDKPTGISSNDALQRLNASMALKSGTYWRA